LRESRCRHGAEIGFVGGSRILWAATACVLAVSLSFFATGSSAAKSQTAPVNTALPTISGTPLVGATLTGSPGTWSGSGVRYSDQWLRCDSSGGNCAPISDATGTTHVVDSADVGSTLRFSVVAVSRKGSTSATSAATGLAAQSSGGSGGSGGVPTPHSSIYWGAYIDGNDTYDYLYGGTWGDAPWDSNTWAKYDSNAGKNPSIIHWGMSPAYGHDFSYWEGILNKVDDAGALNLVGLSTGSDSLASIANGSRDSYWKTFAQEAAAYGKPFFLRFDWEMNGGWYPWGTTSSNQNTPADYVSAWRHVHNIFTAAGATNVTWVWCPNVEYSGSVPYSELYPGDAYVDWTCLDGYNKGSSSRSFSDLFTQSYDDLLKIAPSKPVMVGEVGSLEYSAGTKASWISSMLSELPTDFPQIKALVWFNWRISESGTWHDFEVESSATSKAAWAAGIASPYYAAASSFAMPAPLHPIQPPS
jgi:hypothetical protein